MGARWFTLKQRALLSCIFPVLMGIILICGVFIDLDSPAFVGVCIILGAVTISTGLLGMLGVFSKLVVAIEVTQPLLAVENFIGIIIGILVIIDLSLFRRHLSSTETHQTTEISKTTSETLVHRENIRMVTFLSPRGTSGEQYLMEHRWIGYTAATSLIVTGLLGYVATEMLGSYKTELSVETMVQERRGLWKEYNQNRPVLDPGEAQVLVDREPDREQQATLETDTSNDISKDL